MAAATNRQIRLVSGRAVHVPGDDVDTDRITPARFLKMITFEGLGPVLFYDVRYDADDRPITHPLNDDRYAGAEIMLVGRNFGCGSSREHAPQSIRHAGFKALIGESFSEIFFGNCTTLGVPCVCLPKAQIEAIAERVAADPATEVAVDLDAGEVRCAELRFPFAMPQGSRDALREGQWDPLDALLAGRDAVAAVAARLPYLKA